MPAAGGVYPPSQEFWRSRRCTGRGGESRPPGPAPRSPPGERRPPGAVSPPATALAPLAPPFPSPPPEKAGKAVHALPAQPLLSVTPPPAGDRNAGVRSQPLSLGTPSPARGSRSCSQHPVTSGTHRGWKQRGSNLSLQGVWGVMPRPIPSGAQDQRLHEHTEKTETTSLHPQLHGWPIYFSSQESCLVRHPQNNNNKKNILHH